MLPFIDAIVDVGTSISVQRYLPGPLQHLLRSSGEVVEDQTNLALVTITEMPLSKEVADSLGAAAIVYAMLPVPPRSFPEPELLQLLDELGLVAVALHALPFQQVRGVLIGIRASRSDLLEAWPGCVPVSTDLERRQANELLVIRAQQRDSSGDVVLAPSSVVVPVKAGAAGSAKHRELATEIASLRKKLKQVKRKAKEERLRARKAERRVRELERSEAFAIGHFLVRLVKDPAEGARELPSVASKAARRLRRRVGASPAPDTSTLRGSVEQVPSPAPLGPNPLSRSHEFEVWTSEPVFRDTTAKMAEGRLRVATIAGEDANDRLRAAIGADAVLPLTPHGALSELGGGTDLVIVHSSDSPGIWAGLGALNATDTHLRVLQLLHACDEQGIPTVVIVAPEQRMQGVWREISAQATASFGVDGADYVSAMFPGIAVPGERTRPMRPPDDVLAEDELLADRERRLTALEQALHGDVSAVARVSRTAVADELSQLLDEWRAVETRTGVSTEPGEDLLERTAAQAATRVLLDVLCRTVGISAQSAWPTVDLLVPEESGLQLAEDLASPTSVAARGARAVVTPEGFRRTGWPDRSARPLVGREAWRRHFARSADLVVLCHAGDFDDATLRRVLLGLHRLPSSSSSGRFVQLAQLVLDPLEVADL